MSPQSDVFTNAIEHFAAEQEEIRTAAAFCRGCVLSYTLHHVHILIALYKGNIAIGNLHQFLPAILKLVQSDAKKRLLSLHALKEVCCYCSFLQYSNLSVHSKVVTNCSQGQLEGVAIFCGCHCSRTRTIRRRQLAMSRLRVSGNSHNASFAPTCHNFTCVVSSKNSGQKC